MQSYSLKPSDMIKGYASVDVNGICVQCLKKTDEVDAVSKLFYCSKCLMRSKLLLNPVLSLQWLSKYLDIEMNRLLPILLKSERFRMSRWTVNATLMNYHIVYNSMIEHDEPEYLSVDSEISNKEFALIIAT